MRLSEWLDRTMTRRQFADLLGVHEVTVSRWATGAMMPRPDVIDEIERITKGAVTAQDFQDRWAERVA